MEGRILVVDNAKMSPSQHYKGDTRKQNSNINIVGSKFELGNFQYSFYCIDFLSVGYLGWKDLVLSG